MRAQTDVRKVLSYLKKISPPPGDNQMIDYLWEHHFLIPDRAASSASGQWTGIGNGREKLDCLERVLGHHLLAAHAKELERGILESLSKELLCASAERAANAAAAADRAAAGADDREDPTPPAAPVPIAPRPAAVPTPADGGRAARADDPEAIETDANLALEWALAEFEEPNSEPARDTRRMLEEEVEAARRRLEELTSRLAAYNSFAADDGIAHPVLDVEAAALRKQQDKADEAIIATTTVDVLTNDTDVAEAYDAGTLTTRQLVTAVAGRLGVTDAARIAEFVRPTVKATLEDFVPSDAFTTPAKDAAPCDAETVAVDRVETALGDLEISHLGAGDLEALKLFDDANEPSGDDPARRLFGA